MAEASKILTKTERDELRKKLKPIEIAQLVYAYNGHEEHDFARDLWAHLQDGFVYSLPHVFLMARAVVLDDGRTAWLMNSGAGRLSDIVKLFPFPLPFIAFNRCGRPKLSIYPFPKFQKLADKLSL